MLNKRNILIWDNPKTGLAIVGIEKWISTVQRTIYSKEYSCFLDLLIQARLKAGVTQMEMAKKLKKPQSFVSKYKNGERRLDIMEFIAICKALNVDAKVILNKLLHGVSAVVKLKIK